MYDRDDDEWDPDLTGDRQLDEQFSQTPHPDFKERGHITGESWTSPATEAARRHRQQRQARRDVAGKFGTARSARQSRCGHRPLHRSPRILLF